jgi:hypothetical protein
MDAITKLIKSRTRDPQPSTNTYLPHPRGVQVGKGLSASSAEAIPMTETEQTEASSIGIQLYKEHHVENGL